MKTLVLIALVILATAASTGAANADTCALLLQKINAGGSGIGNSANSYWQHRANFVALLFGQSIPPPSVLQQAAQEEKLAQVPKAEMPSKLAGFKGLVKAVLAQKCLSSAQLSAIREPAIKHAKRVNIDEFPEELPPESSGQPGPPGPPQLRPQQQRH
jgi:hypothetical protein